MAVTPRVVERPAGMAYTENGVTGLVSKLQGLELTIAEAEVLTEIVHAASGEDREVEGFGSRNEIWKPMVGGFLLPVGTKVIEYQDGTDFTSKTGFQGGTDLF